MRIEIASEGRSFKLIIPTGLVLSPIGFTVAKDAIKVRGLNLSDLKWKDIKSIKKTIKMCKKAIPDWYLVDVESSSGERVKIKL